MDSTRSKRVHFSPRLIRILKLCFTFSLADLRLCRSRDRVIGLTSSLHCTASTCCGRVHFHHVRPAYLNGVLPSVLRPILDSSDLPVHDSSAFSHKLTTLLSINNSFTTINIPTTSTQPFCYNTTSTSISASSSVKHATLIVEG